MADTTTSITVTVSNRQGIHARPAHAIAALANRFKANIEIVRDSTVADGKSIIAIMTLAADERVLPPGEPLAPEGPLQHDGDDLVAGAHDRERDPPQRDRVRDGEDATAALEAVEQLISSGFGEGDDKHEAASEAATD